MEAILPILAFSWLLIPFFFVIVNFVYFVIKGKQKTNKILFRCIEICTVVILPTAFLILFDITEINNCCSDSAVFSPAHRIGIYILLIIYTIAYVISMFRTGLFTPVLELLINILLILGIALNILLCIHLNREEFGPLLWMIGNVPIILLLLMKLYQHQILLKTYVIENKMEVNNFTGRLSLSILNLRPLLKYPVLVLLLVPVIILLSLFLLLFGQKPDSMIRAFTDTYKHGFSKLDYMCDNVDCGGHFLCSVGANGHTSIVKPIRYGERNGRKIICNRQLLISNAFEDLIAEKWPLTHTIIRRNYNKVGNFIHRYYRIFNIKIVADIVYFLMKPLEYLFIVTLYTFDKKPENRIAKQYLQVKDRQIIERRLNQHTL